MPCQCGRGRSFGWAESVSASGELVHSLLELLLAGVDACSGTEPRVAAKFLAEALDGSWQGGVAWMPQRDLGRFRRKNDVAKSRMKKHHHDHVHMLSVLHKSPMLPSHWQDRRQALAIVGSPLHIGSRRSCMSCRSP